MIELANHNDDARSILELQSDCDCHSKHRELLKLRQTSPEKRGPSYVLNQNRGIMDFVSFFNSNVSDNGALP